MSGKTLRPAVSLLLVLTVLTGIVYPMAITAVAKVAFASKAGGSLVYSGGRPVGSALIGQAFANPRYFWGRPSATTPQPNNGIGSTGSNLGPLNPALLEAVKTNAAALRAADPGNAAPIPVDLVTASASGLDPDISVAAAQYQAARVARNRHLEKSQVDALIATHAKSRWAGFLGEARVNVLELNLALDSLP